MDFCEAKSAEREVLVDRCPYEEHSIDVVDVTMFPPAMVNIVFWHGNFRSIEYGGLSDSIKERALVKKAGTNLIHVVPNMNSLCALCPRPALGLLLGLEHALPPIPC